jgi:hypothetical protein
MSFGMDPASTKGLKYLDAEGNETLEDDNPYMFILYEASSALPGGKSSKSPRGVTCVTHSLHIPFMSAGVRWGVFRALVWNRT